MNACILFILLNGTAWATPGCYNGGYMMEPQDVVYTQRLPYTYSTQVWAPPQYWVNDWRPWARSYRNWDGYRFSRQQNRRWIRHRRWLSQRRWLNDRRWRAQNRGYRQGYRDGRRWNRRNERRVNKKFRKQNRRGKRYKNRHKNRR